MSGLYVCGQSNAVDLPDAGQGMCCIGAAVYGPHRCTCWQTVYDFEQQPLVAAELTTRTVSCVDCAYRPGSPERQGVAGYSGDAETLDDLPLSGQTFWCHQGMRRVMLLRHPSGVEVPAHPAAYEPPVVDGVPYRADGAPAERCAGWAARAKREP